MVPGVKCHTGLPHFVKLIMKISACPMASRGLSFEVCLLMTFDYTRRGEEESLLKEREVRERTDTEIPPHARVL